MPVNFPYGNNTAYASAAVEIIRKTGVTEGFCHDLGCGDGGLSYELAMRTNLHIISVDSDPGMVAEARKRLDEAGIYGKRVTVHCDDGSTVRYPNYFADLIVSGRSVKDGVQIVDLADVNRIQRPFGGIACFGRSGSMELNVRGELENSGLWTHQYSDPANTVTSSDELAKGMLSALWYVDPDFTMPSRHGRSVSPLCSNGRLFVQGLHGIRAYNAYNGRVLWEFYLEGIQNNYDQDSHLGTNLTHANWCVENGRLYVRIEDTESSSYDRCCLVIDTATGNLLKKYSAPAVGGDNTWGYIAVSKGTLFGTVVNDKHDLRFGRDQHLHIDTSKMYEESSALFAMDAETGTVKWLYKANLSIPHNAIAIGNDRVYLIDRPAAALERMSRRPGKKTFSAMSGGTLIALDADTGEEIFRKNDDIYGTLLAYSPENDILVMTYYEAHPLLSFNLPPDTAGRMTAFSDTDGSLLWDVKTGIATSPKNRPILNGEIVFIEPYAWNIRTGKKQSFTFSRSYGCGILAASKCIMVYRSGTLGYFNLNEPEKGTRNYGGIRPGCWINAIPAGGLVLMPDATERCNCSYLIRATMALQPMEK